jgi:hypothetical protein
MQLSTIPTGNGRLSYRLSLRCRCVSATTRNASNNNNINVISGLLQFKNLLAIKNHSVLWKCLRLFRSETIAGPSTLLSIEYWAKFKILTATNVKMTLFGDVAPCSLVDHRTDDRGSKNVRNVGKFLTDCKAQDLRRQPSVYSPPREPEIALFHILTTYISAWSILILPLSFKPQTNTKRTDQPMTDHSMNKLKRLWKKKNLCNFATWSTKDILKKCCNTNLEEREDLEDLWNDFWTIFN